jgi:hypothetical protein
VTTRRNRRGKTSRERLKRGTETQITNTTRWREKWRTQIRKQRERMGNTGIYFPICDLLYEAVGNSRRVASNCEQ